MGFFKQVVQGAKNLAQHPLLTFKAAVSKEDPYSLRYKAGRRELGKRVGQSVLVGGLAATGVALASPSIAAAGGATGLAGKALSSVTAKTAAKKVAQAGAIAGAVNLGAGKKIIGAKDVIGLGLNPAGYIGGKVVSLAEQIPNLTAGEKALAGAGVAGALGVAGYAGYKYLKGKKAQSSMYPTLPSESTGTQGLMNIQPMASTTALGQEVRTSAYTRRRRTKAKPQALNIRNINRNDIRINQRSKNVITRTNTHKRLMVVGKAKSYTR